MGEFVDLSLAIAFVVISLSFWGAYYITPSKFVTKRFITWFQIKHIDTNITKRSMFYLFLVSSLVLFFLTLAYRYGITNDWNHWLLASRTDIVTTRHRIPFPYRQIYILQLLFLVIFISELAILFVVPFIKRISINKIGYQFVSCLFALVWTFICFGSGSRHLLLYVPIFILLLTVLFLLNKIRYSKRYYFILTVYLVINLLSILLMPVVRVEGYPAIKQYFTKNSDQLVKQALQHSFLISEKEQHILQAKKIFDRYSTNIGLPTELETKSSVGLPTEPKLNNEFFRKIVPRTYPDMPALCFLYYGTHQPYYGITHWLYHTLKFQMPRPILGIMGVEKPRPIEAQLVDDVRNRPQDSKGAFPVGLWTEGYIYFGYIGAILFSILGGIYYGFAAKIIISLSKSNLWNRLDTLLVILHFYYVYLLCGSWGTQYLFSMIRYIVWLCLLIFLINLCCRCFIPKLQTIKQVQEN
jgi:hypothetical protein